MEYSSDDDDSAASSGDEMLNMVVPFSQDSATVKLKGKKSESDDSSDEEEEPPSKKRKRVENDYKTEEKTVNNADIAQVNANRTFKIQFNYQKIGSTKYLFWNERKQKKNVNIYPVRVVPREEIVGLSLKQWNPETERPVQYIQYPHKKMRDFGLYDVVTLRSLTPYHGDGPKDSWCSKRIQQYSKQLKRTLKGMTETDLLTEEAFLKLVLNQSMAEEKNERERALLDRAAPEESESKEEGEQEQQPESDSDDDFEDDGGRKSRRCRSNIVTSEPLRVGDVIEYYRPLSVAGNPDALCQAEIKYINPKNNPILITSDVLTLLPSDHQVKRVKRMNRGKLVAHSGRFRAINSYILKKEGVSACILFGFNATLFYNVSIPTHIDFSVCNLYFLPESKCSERDPRREHCASKSNDAESERGNIS